MHCRIRMVWVVWGEKKNIVADEKRWMIDGRVNIFVLLKQSFRWIGVRTDGRMERKMMRDGRQIDDWHGGRVGDGRRTDGYRYRTVPSGAIWIQT